MVAESPYFFLLHVQLIRAQEILQLLEAKMQELFGHTDLGEVLLDELASFVSKLQQAVCGSKVMNTNAVVDV